MGLLGWIFGSNLRRESGGDAPVDAGGTPVTIETTQRPPQPATLEDRPQSSPPRATRVNYVGDVAIISFVSPNAFHGAQYSPQPEIAELLEHAWRKIVFDFSNIASVDTLSLGWLLTLHRMIDMSGGKLVLHKVNNYILEGIKLCRLDRIFTIISAQDHGTICSVIRAGFGAESGAVEFSPQWRTGTAVAIARQMTETQDFTAMPILADALQDAGCDHAEILEHCRGCDSHPDGCWVVDLVLDRKADSA